MSTQLYTLDDARKVLAREKCDSLGHDYQIVVTAMNTPSDVFCGRCGGRWPVQAGAEDPAKLKEAREVSDSR